MRDLMRKYKSKNMTAGAFARMLRGSNIRGVKNEALKLYKK